MLLMGEELATSMADMMSHLFSISREEAMDVNALFKVINDGVYQIVSPLLWIFFIIMLAALVGNILLGGMSFSWEAMAPKASKLSPIAGFKRMFGVQAAVELVKSILKFFVVFIVAFLLLSGFV